LQFHRRPPLQVIPPHLLAEGHLEDLGEVEGAAVGGLGDLAAA
jgi:hypothetical protein